MKVRIFRISSLPLEVVDLQAHKEEWISEYDKLALECGEDMLMLQKKCEELATKLQEKYKCIDKQEMPKNRKQWAALVAKYEAPVLIAPSAENPKELVLVICDQPILAS